MQCVIFGPPSISCMQDEVLAVSRKMVVRVEDLVRWSCGQPTDWCGSQKGAPHVTNGLHKSQQGSDENGDSNSSGDPCKGENRGSDINYLLDQMSPPGRTLVEL